MKKFITLIIAIGFSLFIMTSFSKSGNNTVSEKELEIPKKELDFKQKELGLQVNELIHKDLILQKQYTKPTAPNSTTELDLSGNYNFENHDVIKVFILDLAKAVNNNDKNSIAKMINFPFIDEWGDNPYNQSVALGCKTENQFFAKYDKIFTNGIKKAILENKYRGWTDGGWGDDVIEKGEYLITGDGSLDGESKRPHIMLGLKKVKGKFKIYAIKFFS